jgi:hypothetical protein
LRSNGRGGFGKLKLINSPSCHPRHPLSGIQDYFMRGFAPADEVLLFRQKCPKPFPPVRVLSDLTQKQGLQGTSASAPNKMAQKLAPRYKATSPLKQSSPRKPIRCYSSAAPNANRHSSNTHLSQTEGCMPIVLAVTFANRSILGMARNI